jgi:hypothetical protein
VQNEIMNEHRRVALEKETLTINRILVKAQEAYKIVELLTAQTNDSDDLCYVKGMYSFLAYSKQIYWQVTVTELCKLFIGSSKEDTKKMARFNLRHYIQKFRNDGEFSQAKISQEILDDWNVKLDKEDSAINNLKIQRDKRYAHEDSNSEEIWNSVAMEKIQELLQIGYSILNEINISVFKRGIDYDPINSPVKNLQFILGKLEEDKKKPNDWHLSTAKKLGLI